MEGYLGLRSSFSISKVWVVLDGQQLTYYDKLDLSLQIPKGLKGTVFLKGAIVNKVTDRSIAHGISIKTEKSKVVFDCDEAQYCSTWYNALIRALELHKVEEDRINLPKEYKKQLGIDSTTKLTRNVIVRAYKILCLKEHPDKGGNVENFNKINLAYNSLIALQEAEDLRKNSRAVRYEAIIEKGGAGVGLGIVVAEDKVRRQIVVQRTTENIDIKGLTEESKGEIRPGDAVIGIDQDDCSHWFLGRVKARLGPLRVPVGCQIHFTFERLVPLDEEDSNDGEHGGHSSPLSPPESPVPTSKYNNPRNISKIFKTIDEDESAASPMKNTQQNLFIPKYEDGSNENNASNKKDEVILDQVEASVDVETRRQAIPTVVVPPTSEATHTSYINEQRSPSSVDNNGNNAVDPVMKAFRRASVGERSDDVAAKERNAQAIPTTNNNASNNYDNIGSVNGNGNGNDNNNPQVNTANKYIINSQILNIQQPRASYDGDKNRYTTTANEMNFNNNVKLRAASPSNANRTKTIPVTKLNQTSGTQQRQQQSVKNEENNTVPTNFKFLDTDNINNFINSLPTNNKNSNSQTPNHSKQVAKSNEDVAIMKSEYSAQIGALNIDNEMLKLHNQELSNQVERLNEELNDTKQMNTRLLEINNHYEASNMQLQQQLQQSLEELEVTQEHNDRLSQDNRDLCLKLAAALDVKKIKKQDNNNSVQEIVQLKHQLIDSQKEIKELKCLLSSLYITLQENKNMRRGVTAEDDADIEDHRLHTIHNKNTAYHEKEQEAKELEQLLLSYYCKN